MIDTLEQANKVTVVKAVEAVRAAADALAGQWSQEERERLYAAANLLESCGAVLRPAAVQYAHAHESIRELAANVDTATATMKIMLGSLALLSSGEPDAPES